MSESVEAQLDIFKTEHNTQYIIQVGFAGDETEHIICTYPRFGKKTDTCFMWIKPSRW